MKRGREEPKTLRARPKKRVRFTLPEDDGGKERLGRLLSYIDDGQYEGLRHSLTLISHENVRRAFPSFFASVIKTHGRKNTPGIKKCVLSLSGFAVHYDLVDGADLSQLGVLDIAVESGNRALFKVCFTITVYGFVSLVYSY